ncbi:unnamed protein product [Plutella xylostella]|uniref:(diamondback moth) hypothetical protein n=1 Tax=Plutella xylostella TaxID=51655 RepID=A0A8S4G382_PLUXY|nr:unnamed protein product [Plutella xylostella]
MSSAFSERIEVDNVLRRFTLSQKYHVVLGFLLFIAFASNSLTGSQFVFAADYVQYKCHSSFAQCGVNTIKNVTFENQFDQQCYERVPLDEAATCLEVNQSTLAPCNDWVYENPDSFVAEFQLACQEWKRTLVGTMHSFGNMIGLLIVGPVSDRIGRKKALIITGCLGGVLGLARSFSAQYWLYIVLQTVETAVGDICSPAFMLAVEAVSARDRAKFFMITQLGYQFGNLVLVLMAWLFSYYRTFLQVVYAPLMLFILYTYLIDESPRWLLTKERKNEALEILEKAAKTNKIVLEKGLLENITCEKEEKAEEIGYLMLLKTTFSSKMLLQRFLICVVWWFTSTFVSYGLTVNSVLWGGNKYLNYAFITIIDIPAVLIMGYVLKRFKRKKPLICSFSCAALFFLIQPFLPAGMTWLSLAFFLAGKFMASIFFNITYVFTSELFPTHTRNSMHALCSSLGRIGSILAPQTPLLLSYWAGLPAVLFGSASALAAIVTIFVPDTADDSLPDTVRQAEVVGQRKKSLA